MDTSSFEKYLQEVHAKDYHGTDDAMSDAFEAWLAEKDGNELMKLAEELVKELNKQIEDLLSATEKLQKLSD